MTPLDLLVKIGVPIINALAAQLPGLFERIRASGDLTADGQALLDSTEQALLERKRRADEIARNPLPVPER